MVAGGANSMLHPIGMSALIASGLCRREMITPRLHRGHSIQVVMDL